MILPNYYTQKKQERNNCARNKRRGERQTSEGTYHQRECMRDPNSCEWFTKVSEHCIRAEINYYSRLEPVSPFFHISVIHNLVSSRRRGKKKPNSCGACKKKAGRLFSFIHELAYFRTPVNQVKFSARRLLVLCGTHNLFANIKPCYVSRQSVGSVSCNVAHSPAFRWACILRYGDRFTLR